MDEDSLYYKGWPYNVPPTNDDMLQADGERADDRDAAIMDEQREIDAVQALEDLRGLLILHADTGFIQSGATTVDELLFAIDMTIGAKPR